MGVKKQVYYSLIEKAANAKVGDELARFTEKHLGRRTKDRNDMAHRTKLKGVEGTHVKEENRG
jgi:hypothetical protein